LSFSLVARLELRSKPLKFVAVDAGRRNRSPTGFFLSNREFIANEGKKQVLLIALGYFGCRSFCDFNGIAQRSGRFPVPSEKKAVDGNEAAQERLEEIQAFRRERDPDLGSKDITTIVRVIVSPDNPNHAPLLLKMAMKLYRFQPHAQIKLEP
jgi:hypothetical protein